MILGVDPGQRRDPAGLAVVDGFDILHLERVLGLSYPRLAERVAVLLAQLPAARPGGVGRPACAAGGYADRMRAEVRRSGPPRSWWTRPGSAGRWSTCSRPCT